MVCQSYLDERLHILGAKNFREGLDIFELQTTKATETLNFHMITTL